MRPRTPDSALRGRCAARFAACACLLLAACATHHARRAAGGARRCRTFAPPPADGAIFHTGYSPGLFDNPTAHNVGDTVTVVLQEATTAQKSSQTDTAKTTKDALPPRRCSAMP